jgi:single-strand DNA-binding protein
MAGINKVILVGNLGRDPEVTSYENGVKRAAFSLATTESYRDKEGNWQDQTEWHNIVLWRWLAEKNLVKGDKIYLEGRLRTRSWDDENGQKRYTTEIQGDKVLKLASAGSQPYSPDGYASASPGVSEPPVQNTQQPAAENEQAEEDDLPF